MSSRMGVLDALCPCGCEKYSQENLCDHLEEEHAEMLFKCNIPQCDSRRMYYWKLHHLRNHIEHHHGDFRKDHRNLFDKEKKLIVSNATLANDNIILYPLNLKEFRCRICNSKKASFRSFLLTNALRHVTETHPTQRRPHETLKYRCRECCRNFLDDPDLQLHIDAEHAKEIERAQKTRLPPALPATIKEEPDSDIEIIDLFSSCSFCQANVAESESRSHLKEHYDCLFQCDACRLGFEEYQKIEEHIVSCSDIPSSARLSRHRRVFIKFPRQRDCLKVFKCCVSNCDRKFIGQPASNLIEHMKATHKYLSPQNNISLYCRICGDVTMFDSSDEIENHINNNHPDERRPPSSDLRSPKSEPVESRRTENSRQILESDSSSPDSPEYRCSRPETRRQTRESDSGSPQYQPFPYNDESRCSEFRHRAHKSDSGSPEYQPVQSKQQGRHPDESDSGSPEYQTDPSKDECRYPDSGSPEYQMDPSKEKCRYPDSYSPQYQTVQSKSRNEGSNPDNSEYGCEMYERESKEISINGKRKASFKMRQDKSAKRSSSSSSSSCSSEEDSSSLEEETRKKSLAFAKAFNKLKEREKLRKLRRKKLKKSKSLHRKCEKMTDSERSSGNNSEGRITYTKKKKMNQKSSIVPRDDTKKKLEDENEILDQILDKNLNPEKKRGDIEEKQVELDRLKLRQIQKKIKSLAESERSQICDKKESTESFSPKIPSEDRNKETIISENDRDRNFQVTAATLGEDLTRSIVERVLNSKTKKSEDLGSRRAQDNHDTQTANVDVTKKKQKTKTNEEKAFQLSLEKRKGQNKIFNIHCAFCEKDFGDVTEMRSHVYDEHTEMLFKCKLCSKSSKGFDTTRGLMDHMKKTHGMNKLLEQIIGEESSRESVQLPEKFLFKISCSNNNCTTRPELGRNGLWLGRNLPEVKDDIFTHNRLLHRMNSLCSDQVQIELSCRACNNFKAVDALGKPDEAKWNKHFNIDHVKRFVHNYKLDKQKKKS